MKPLKPETVRTRLTALNRQLLMAKLEWEITELDIWKQISALRDRCEHKRTEYYPDPSGNNDSHTECKTCGRHWPGIGPR